MTNRRSGLFSLVVVAVALVGLVAASVAEAKGRKRKRGKVNVQALAELMGPFKFGMTKKQVLRALAKQINEKYAEKIKEATDIYTQDKLRKAKRRELKRIKSSYVEFSGKKTGWDVSIIDGEFAHDTGESMMVYWENVGGKNQRRFFFFHNDQLWKMYIALNSKQLKRSQQNFPFLKSLMEKRFGPGEVHYVEARGEKKPSHITWKTRRYKVRAIDQLQFYGNFCLAISDPGVERALEPLRAANKKPKQQNRVIEAVLTKDEDDEPDLDDNKGALDWMK